MQRSKQGGMTGGFRVAHTEVVEWAIEALTRANYGGIENGTFIGHPEDVVAALAPALEAVAVGYAEGYRRGRADATGGAA